MKFHWSKQATLVNYGIVIKRTGLVQKFGLRIRPGKFKRAVVKQELSLRSGDKVILLKQECVGTFAFYM